MQQPTCTSTWSPFPPIKINVQIPHQLKGRVEVHFQSEQLRAPWQVPPQPAYAGEETNGEPFPSVQAPEIVVSSPADSPDMPFIKEVVQPASSDSLTRERTRSISLMAPSTTLHSRDISPRPASTSSIATTSHSWPQTHEPDRIKTHEPDQRETQTGSQRHAHLSDHHAAQLQIHQDTHRWKLLQAELREESLECQARAQLRGELQHAADATKVEDRGRGTRCIDARGCEAGSLAEREEKRFGSDRENEGR